MLFVVRGRIVIKLDGEDIVMEKGDCLYFFGETPHEVRRLGRQKARAMRRICALTRFLVNTNQISRTSSALKLAR